MATLLPEGKQSFTNSAGSPLVGGKLYTYDAGTSTPRLTYQNAAGTVPNANPIILDARGEAIVFWSGVYKVVLKDASDVIIWTVDGIESQVTQSGLNDVVLSYAGPAGSLLIGHTPSEAGSSATTVWQYLRNIQSWRVNVKDAPFYAKGDGVTDDTAAIQAAINFASASVGSDYWETYYADVWFPPGVYLIGGLTYSVPLHLSGAGKLATALILKTGANTSAITFVTPTVATNDTYRQSSTISDMTVDCNGSGQVGTSHGIYLPDSPNPIATRYDGSLFVIDVIIRAAKNSNIFVGSNRNNGALDRVVSVYAGADCFTLSGYDWRVSDSDFGNGTSSGLRMNGGGAIASDGCNFYANGDCGVVISNNVNAPCSFSGCYFDTNAKRGFYAAGTSLNYVYHSVTASAFRDNGTLAVNTYAHVELKDLMNATVTDCSFVVNQAGVRASYCVFLDNTPSIVFAGMADTVNAATKPYATAVCNMPQNCLSPTFLVDTWSTYTPVVTSGTGAITTAAATGRYLRRGKVVFWEAQVIITTNGTGATTVNASLPFTVGASLAYGAGRNATVGGGLIVEFVPTTTYAAVRKYDDTYPGANGITLNLSGVYESV